MSQGWTPTAPPAPRHTHILQSYLQVLPIYLSLLSVGQEIYCSTFLPLVTCLMVWCKCSSTRLPGDPAENKVSHSLADEQIGSGVVFSPWITAEDFPFWYLYPTFKLIWPAGCKGMKRGTCGMTAKTLLLQWARLKTDSHVISEITTCDIMAVSGKNNCPSGQFN